MESISIYILLIVLVLIVIRDIGPLNIPIWMIMLGGAIATLITFQITVQSAWHSINWNIIGYLIGVFIIGQALEESGLLQRFSEGLFAHARTGRMLLFTLIFVFGLLSALLMNDTVAIIATPLLLMIARQNNFSATPLLLALAFAVTIGSVFSPIGNPQNLLIASESTMKAPFSQFLKYLTIPTIICLFLCFLFSYGYYRKTLGQQKITTELDANHLPFPSLLCKISLTIMILLIIAKSILDIYVKHDAIPFSVIAIISCLPIVIFSPNRLTVIKKMDWHTIIFFISMFILMQSVWDGGVIQHLLKSSHVDIHSIPSILIIGAIVSQFISNVPLVALYLPLLVHHHGTTNQYLALAAGSTLAGNFFIIGAASTIIIIQNAEKRDQEAFSAWEFCRLGIPLGIVCLIVFWLFLK
jgi:Na+/H+ antiporter NhaD/arsenite permease-like protein